MASQIKAIPELNGTTAIKFNKKASRRFLYERGSIDFSDQIKITNSILKHIYYNFNFYFCCYRIIYF